MYNENNKTRQESLMMMKNIHIVCEDFIDEYEPTVPAHVCAQFGFVFMQDGHLISNINRSLFSDAVDAVGVDIKKNNQTFHKSFSTVEETDLKDLFCEQIVHYLSTYGLESMGMHAMPFIPAEKLEVPCALPKYITVIEVVNERIACRKITDFFCKITRPSYDLVNAFRVLINYMLLGEESIQQLKSYEFQTMFCDYFGIVPSNPVAFLRFVVYKITGSPMLNNSARDCRVIKMSAKSCRPVRVAEYLRRADMEKLASIFLRYKNIFLALKAYKDCPPIINKLRRLADIYHKPLNNVCVQNFYQLALAGKSADCLKILSDADFFTLVKLFNYGAHKLENEEIKAGVFNIRNGRTFVKEDYLQPLDGFTAEQYERIIETIVLEMRKRVNFDGKTFYMPSHIIYAAPVSEKQFVGNIPWGSRVQIATDKAFTFGIAWDNQDDERVDLDLHMHSANGQIYGWNGYYRRKDNEDNTHVIFTGDQTDATNGAAEAFYFKPETDEVYCLDVAQYSGPHKTPFKLFMNDVKPTSRKEKYTYSPENDIMPAIPLCIDINHDCGCVSNLGFVQNNTFVFYGGSLSNNIGGHSEYYSSYLKSQVGKCENQLFLEDLITLLGGTIIHEMPENMEEVINLSPEVLTPTTITGLFE